MSVSILYPPELLLERLGKWGNISNPLHAKLYEKIQTACDMGVAVVCISGDDAETLTQMYMEYDEEKEHE
jgi:hypothetical protein